VKLKLSDWASIAEVVSAIAVVISLVYVGIQINENTGETRAANRQLLITRSHLGTMAAAGPESSAIFAKVTVGTALTPTELAQYGFLMRTVLYDVQEAYLLYREGRLDEEYWNTRAAVALAFLAPAPARDSYHRDRSIGAFHTDFVEWLDGAIEERYGD